MKIESRVRILVNTDPQRRCYNGVHARSELQWTEWSVLESEISEEKINARLLFWTELNDYAVKERGRGAKREHRIVE
jgi:hypothetical protein